MLDKTKEKVKEVLKDIEMLETFDRDNSNLIRSLYKECKELRDEISKLKGETNESIK